MSEQVLEKFFDLVDQDTLTDDVKITYREAGGMPSEATELTVQLTGASTDNLRIERHLPNAVSPPTISMDREEIHRLFRQIRLGINSLVARPQARFLPDSVVGSITIEVGGETETFFFLADEKQRTLQNKPISPEITSAIRSLNSIALRRHT